MDSTVTNTEAILSRVDLARVLLSLPFRERAIARHHMLGFSLYDLGVTRTQWNHLIRAIRVKLGVTQVCAACGRSKSARAFAVQPSATPTKSVCIQCGYKKNKAKVRLQNQRGCPVCGLVECDKYSGRKAL